MEQWLNLEIAQSMGIAANIDFLSPESFIWQQFKYVLDDLPEQNPFNKISMTWQIMKILPECLADPDFSSLYYYLKNDVLGRKRYQLSQKIADIFDQYLAYRPEWIDAWSLASDQEISTWGNDNPHAIPQWLGAQLWQAKLWKILAHKIAACYCINGKVYQRAEAYKKFLSELESKKSLKYLPKRIFIFGVSTQPESYLQALLGLAKHCDVHFLMSSPCRYYWADISSPALLGKRFAQSRPTVTVVQGEIVHLADTSWQKNAHHRAWALSADTEAEVGNPLLASMGALARNFLYQLYRLEQNEIDAFVDIEPNSLLHRLQADILELQDSSSALDLEESNHAIISKEDRSFSIHIAHSVMREVEILHDNLLSMFASSPTLTPKDIIVMIPNVDLYAPYVQAVFSGLSGQGDKQQIPFTISDVSGQQESPILVSFLQLLNLNQTRATREDILSLLAVPAILNRFNIKQDNFELLKKWIDESGIRWGLSNKSSVQWSLPELTQNSWLFGLKRMLLGFAMGDGMFAGISAYDEVEGLQGDLLGRFIYFIDTLIRLENALKQAYNAAQWQTLIYQLLDDFYLEDAENTALLSSIRLQIDNLMTYTTEAQYTQTLSLFVLIEYLEKHLLTATNRQQFLTGKVNFCTLMSMRTIPFKVVCLLGMSDGSFPRNIVSLGFDLMAGHQERGDVTCRDEDRYQFLEAILSAQDKLYISYVGRNINDNSEKTPSVLVSELVNYCLQSFTLKNHQQDPRADAKEALSDFIHQQYPMQSFSRWYYTGRFKTYQSQWWSAIYENANNGADIDEQVIKIPAAVQIIDVQIKQLIHFLKHSCKFFFTQRLSVYFETSDDTLDDDEPFSLNSLEQYKLKEQQFEYALYGKSLPKLFAKMQANGELPLGEFAPLIFKQNLPDMEDLASLVQAHFAFEVEAVHVQLCFAKGTPKEKYLLGELSDHCKNGLVRIKTGRVRSKDILALWVEHLCYCIADGQGLNSSLFAQDKGIFFREIPADFAYQRLKELLNFYEQGMQRPIPFFAESSFVWAKSVHSIEPDCFVYDELQFTSRAEGQDCALKEFNSVRGFPEGNDAYIQRAFTTLEDNWLEFEKIAFTIFQPVLVNMNTIEYEKSIEDKQ